VQVIFLADQQGDHNTRILRLLTAQSQLTQRRANNRGKTNQTTMDPIGVDVVFKYARNHPASCTVVALINMALV